VRAGRPRADARSRIGRKSHCRTRAKRTLNGTIAPYVPDAAHPDGEKTSVSHVGDADDDLSVAGLGVYRLLGVRIPRPAVDDAGRHEFQGAEEAREVLH